MHLDRRSGDDAFHRVLSFFKRFFVVMGVAATIVSVFLVITLNKVVHYTPPSLPDNMILAYTFKSGLPEKTLKPSLSQPLLRPAETFHEIIEDLTLAAKDSRVKGFAARIQDIDLTPAQIQEMRATIVKFRQSGKFAVAFASDFGELGSSMGGYYLASAFDKIWLQPVGVVSITGVSAEIPFLKDVLDKIGVTAQFDHKGVYKSAPESLTETGMSSASRKMMTGLVDDLSAQIVADISQNRRIPLNLMPEIINGAPYPDEAALKLNLIDKIGYYDQMADDLLSKAGAGAELVNLSGYSFGKSITKINQGMFGFISRFMRKADPAYLSRNKAKIALIFGSGDIIPYRASGRGGFGESGMSADKISETFEDVRNDADVAAVVFRVDSRGGSPVAAETIRRAIMETQKKGKPVIVSMGSYAASGGYWVATPADKIVAEPATITGSIGVFGGKFVLEKMWEKIGVNWESVTAGDNARMWSANVPFSKKEMEKFSAILDNIYESFLTRVMEGRKMTREQALAAAEGRVWTGRQAREMGLVDDLGGLDRAVELAKTAAKLGDADVPVERFPPQKSTLEMFIDLAVQGVFFDPHLSISAEDILRGVKAWSEKETGILKMPAITGISGKTPSAE